SSLLLPKPTGTVTYSFYKSADCGGDVFASSQHSVDGSTGLSDGSAATGALGAGNYSFSASYTSDNNYVGSTALCEPFTVDKAQLAITTTIPGGSVVSNVQHFALGSTPHDNAS